MNRLIVAIVGLGPWGLCVLERLSAGLRHAHRQAVIHVFEPGPSGAGVHTPDGPDYLLMNTVCGQVSLFGRDVMPAATGLPGLTFFEWAVRSGYRMAGDDCVAPVAGAAALSGEREVSPHDFLPRSVLGRYLCWVYEQLVANLPGGVRLIRHDQEVVDVIRCSDHTELVVPAVGEPVACDEVFLTTGHTGNCLPSEQQGLLSTYPIARLQSAIRPGESVVIAGMGLVAVDAIAALTIGRGGRFRPTEDGLARQYLPSGAEPRISLYSRNGLPFCCRPAVSFDTTGVFRPSILTEDALAARRRERTTTTGQPLLDFRSDVLPLLWAEMSLVYYRQCAMLGGGAEAADEVRRVLVSAWCAQRFEEALAHYASEYGRFDPETLFFPPEVDRCRDSEAYERIVRRLVEDDVAESRKGEARSPAKAALELFRVLRDVIRSAVEFGGLTSASSREFRERVGSAINRIIVGPPIRRGAELLALMDAGIVRMPFGPSPGLRRTADGRRWEIASTRLEKPFLASADHVVTGYLSQPTIGFSASTLWGALYSAGRVRAYGPGRGGECGIDVGQDCHPRDVRGEAQECLWVLGPLTEGIRYFTHYIPSPKSRMRAFLDADTCVRHVLERSARPAGPAQAQPEAGRVSR